MAMRKSVSAQVARWATDLTFDDLPRDVVEATKLRVMDVIGLALAGTETDFGRSTRGAAVALSPPGPCQVFGTGDRIGVASAAFVNAALAQALEYDDTHNESIVHMSSPSVASALALSEIVDVSGHDVITAVALGSEIACRVGCVSPGQFHKRGFHPTGLFSSFGVSYLTSWILGLDAEAMVRAAGTCGSFAAGILQAWVDGAQSKFLHSGWAAQSGISAAFLARAGMIGPSEVFEGRFGLLATHLQDEDVPRDFSRVTANLGSHWESRQSSFKPYPAAHVLHPYIDAALRLRRERGLQPDLIERVECPVTPFIVPIVCEPTSEKLAPASDSHGRVSLQYSIAEALYTGSLGRRAYGPQHLSSPEILALARRVRYYVDPQYPGPGRFKGALRVTLTDGRSFEEIQEYNRGSVENPMTPEELRAKFDENADGVLSAAESRRLADEIARLEDLPDASVLVALATKDTTPSR